VITLGGDTPDAAGHMIHLLPDRALRSDIPRGIQPEPLFLGLLHSLFKPFA
jgi:hypothetical protein